MLKNVFLRSITVMIASNITMFAGSLVDSVLISRFLGSECMAAYGIVAPVNLIVVMVSLVFSSGLQNNCAGLLATGKPEEARQMFSASVLIEAGIALVISVAMILFRGSIADILLMGKESSALLQGYVEDYLVGLAPGMIVLALLPSLSFLMYVEGKGNVVIWSVIIQLAVNIAGDLVSVFLLQGGMIGMGLATTLCYYAALVAFALSMIRSPGVLGFTLKNISLRSAFPVIKDGAPTALERLYASLRTIILNGFLLTLSGSIGVAAFSIMVTLQSIYNSVSMGLASTTQTAVSAFVKEEDETSLTDLLRISLSYGLIIEIALMAIVYLTAPLVTCLFVADRSSADYSITVSALKLFAFSIPFYNINSTLQKFYQGTGQFIYTYLYSLLNNFIFLVGGAYVLGGAIGTDGIWLAFTVTEVCTILVVLLVTWIKSRRVTFSLRDLMYLPADFGRFEDEGICGSASSMDEITTFSEKLHHYCLSRGAGSKFALLIALTAEEMGGNVIRWGFKGKNGHLDMRLVRKGNSWILRIRDDCPQFNPAQWLKIHQPEDPSQNIGIRMIFSMADDLQYINLLGMNQLILQVSADSCKQ